MRGNLEINVFLGERQVYVLPKPVPGETVWENARIIFPQIRNLFGYKDLPLVLEPHGLHMLVMVQDTEFVVGSIHDTVQTQDGSRELLIRSRPFQADKVAQELLIAQIRWLLDEERCGEVFEFSGETEEWVHYHPGAEMTRTVKDLFVSELLGTLLLNLT